MTARISLNLGRTGGHRPPLQSEHFLPLGKAPLERQASNDLAGSRLRSGGLARDWAIPAVDPIDISETAHPPAPGVEDWRRSGIGASGLGQINRAGQEQAVKYVMELRPYLQCDVPLAIDEEIAAQTHGLGRLALPSVVVVVGCGSCELPGGRICPRILIQHEVLGRIDATNVWILQK